MPEGSPTRRPARAGWRQRRALLSLRGLMLAVLLAGLGVGWYVRLGATRHDAVATLRAAGGSVTFRDQDPKAAGGWLALYRRTGWSWAREVDAVVLTAPASPDWRDAAVAALGQVGHVERAWIAAGPIAPALRQALAAAGVAELTLRIADQGPSPLDESLAELSWVPSLRELVIDTAGQATLPPATLRWAGAVTQLQSFSIRGVDDPVAAPFEADAATLARWTDLVRLHLDLAPREGAYLDGLVGADQLRVVIAPATRATDAQLRRLAERSPHLEHLALNGSRLADAGTAALGPLKRLEELELRGRPSAAGAGAGAGVTDATLATLGRLGALRRLTLTCGHFTDQGLDALGGATRLSLLDLGGCDAVSQPALARLLGSRTWEYLGLRGSGINDAALPTILGGISAGTFLSLADSGVTDAGMPTLATLLVAKPVPRVVLTGTRVTDAGLAALAQSPIRSLILDRTAVTDAGLRSLAAAPLLGRIDARGTAVTVAGAAAYGRAGGWADLTLGPLPPEADQ